jgi:hypothetical protein
MIRQIALSIIVILSLQACAPPAPRSPISQFSEADIAWSKRQGTGVVSGQGFMRQQGGGVVTCAGDEVALTPVAAYSTERMAILYNSTNKGYNTIGFGARHITAPPQEYLLSSKRSTCNAQGNFSFSALAPGEYYVTTRVAWVAANSPQGASIMERVRATDGREVEVILTPR